MGRSVGLRSRPKVLQRARLSRVQLSWRGVMSARESERGWQVGGSQRQRAMVGDWSWPSLMMRWAQPHSRGHGKERTEVALVWRKAALNGPKLSPRWRRQTAGTAERPG